MTLPQITTAVHLRLQGPCCLLIRSTTAAGEDAVFGAFTEHRWKDSNRFYGSASTFLFTLKPNFNVYRAKAGSNDAFQWLNLKASCSYSDLYLLDDLLQMQSYGLQHGLGFGGSTEKFRLFIPDTMETCSACASCLTFESGPLLPNSGIAEFQIDTLEVCIYHIPKDWKRGISNNHAVSWFSSRYGRVEEKSRSVREWRCRPETEAIGTK